MRNFKALTLIFVFVTGSFIVKAQQADSITQKLDEYLNSANKFHKFNGSALIAQHGTVLLQRSYGYKNFRRHVPDDSNTIYQVGSITKQFTANPLVRGTRSWIGELGLKSVWYATTAGQWLLENVIDCKIYSRFKL